MVTPLRNEFRPPKPLSPWVQPPNTFRYKVTTGDTWLTLGARNNHEYGEQGLIWINFKLSPLDYRYTDQVNWYLREYVGCRHSFDAGRNWAFTDDANPGYIFLPYPTYEMDNLTIKGSRGLGGVNAPQYDDENWYDKIKIDHLLDIYGAVDMGISVSEVALPALVEAGMIPAGAATAVVGPLVGLGSAHDEALKSTSRQFFFSGFCSALVMKADGWTAEKVDAFYPPLQYPPANDVYSEKRETFRVLYNYGLKAGLLQGGRLNQVDIKNLFVFLRSRLKPTEAREYSGALKDWSVQKRKNYYDRLASILKDDMLKNNLQLRLR